RTIAPYMSMPTAVYSPVGSKPATTPRPVMAGRSTPPFWGVACWPPLVLPSLSLPPHAAATRARARASPTKRTCCRLLPINPPCRLLRDPSSSSVREGRAAASFLRPACSPLRGTECVPQAVTHEVERQGGGEQEQAGEHHHPPGHGEDRPGGRVREHPPPRRRGLGHPDAQERQRRLEQDVGRDQQGRVDHDRR